MTSYTTVYDIFLSKITDSGFLALSSFEDLVERYLKNAINKFTCCQQNLENRNDTTNTFNFALTSLEQEILACYMLVEYLTPQIYNVSLLQQSMTNKDFQLTSQANHLKQLMELRKLAQEDINRLLTIYTFDKSAKKLSDLK